MGLPTLYKEGYLIPKPWFNEREKKMTGIQYIIKHIHKLHVDEKKHQKLNSTIKSMGDKIILVKAGTGSGKTTSLAPELYISLKHKKNIAIAIPTIIITKEKTYDVINIPEFKKNFKLGKNIGYVTGDSKSNIRITERGILFMTQGILKGQLLRSDNEHFMRKYDFIFFDEFHLRTIDTDFTLSLIKNFLEKNWKNPNCPIFILMSATFKEKIYMNYFHVSEKNYLEVKGALNFPVEENFSKVDVDDYLKHINNLILDIHINNLDDLANDNEIKDIIVFLPSTSSINKTIDYIDCINASIFSKNIEKMIKKKKYKTKIDLKKKYFLSPIKLTSSSYNNIGNDYKKFMSSVKNIKQKIYTIKNGKVSKDSFTIEVPSRKIFLSTPVAETGITIESLKYCIDSGYQNLVTYYPEFNASIICIAPTNKFAILQRKGRIGRIAPGVWHTCFTKKIYDYLPMSKIPSILNQDLTYVILSTIIDKTETKIKNLNSYDEERENEIFEIDLHSKYNIIDKEKEFDINEINYITNPTNNMLSFSLEKLYKLGFINYNYDITLLGYLGNSFKKYKIEYVKMLFSGFKYGARISDLITIMAGEHIKTVIKRYDKDSKIFYKHFRYKNSDEILHSYIFTDDLLELVYLYDKFNLFVGKLLKAKCANIDNDNSDFLDEIEKWCDNMNLDYINFMKFLEKRDEIFSLFIDLGIDPFYDELKSKSKLIQLIYTDLYVAIGEIKKIKKCIYEGFINNVLYFDDGKYYLKKYDFPVKINTHLMIPKKHLQNKPKMAIATNLFFKMDEKGNFVLNASGISPLDCYINIDEILTK